MPNISKQYVALSYVSLVSSLSSFTSSPSPPPPSLLSIDLASIGGGPQGDAQEMPNALRGLGHPRGTGLEWCGSNGSDSGSSKSARFGYNGFLGV